MALDIHPFLDNSSYSSADASATSLPAHEKEVQPGTLKEPKTPKEHWINNGNYPDPGARIDKAEYGRYFLGLMQKDEHTYIVSGVQDKTDLIFLARFGKYFLCDSQRKVKMHLSLFFGATQLATIYRGGLLHISSSKESEYEQYRYDLHHITEDEHNKFIAFMHFLTSQAPDPKDDYEDYHSSEKISAGQKGLKSKQPGAYAALKDGGYIYKNLSDIDAETLALTDGLDALKTKASELNESAYTISRKNTCRIFWLKIFSEFVPSAPEISQTYWKPLISPVNVNPAEGIKASMMIMPMKLKDAQSDSPKQKTLETLYSLLHKLRGDESAAVKFSVVKRLYDDIQNVEDGDIQCMTETLETCLSDHAKVIDRHRSDFRFGSTRTRKVLTGLLSSLRSALSGVNTEYESVTYVKENLPSPQAGRGGGELTTD